MPLESWVEKEPRQFEYFHRVMGYLMLSLLVVIYYYTSPDVNYQIYVPLFFLFAVIINPKLSRWLQYRFSKKIKNYVLFVIDAVVVAVTLSAIHLSLVLSFIALFALLYTAINNKIPFLIVSMAILLGIVVFYLSNIFIFGFAEYFDHASTELIVLSFICLSAYFGVGGYYQNRRTHYLNTKRKYYYEQMNRYMELANQLSRYAPLQLWQSILRGEAQAKIEYKRKKMTIFFSDIQGFTELSETLIPDDLAFLLNDYLSHMTDIAKQYGGTVDKFMGDAILIFFGDPHSNGVAQDAKTCVEMALAMRQQMKLLRERWLKMGYPALHIRMGVSTGYCHVGNYGAAHRMAYTIVGRDANLAARLQSAAKVDEILISDETYQLVKSDYLCAPKPPIFLKGIQGPVKTWQIMEKHNVRNIDNQQWFDYEAKGFHLVLNFDEAQNFEYPEMVKALKDMVKRIELQQKLTNSQGIVKLNSEDEIPQEIKRETFSLH